MPFTSSKSSHTPSQSPSQSHSAPHRPTFAPDAASGDDELAVVTTADDNAANGSTSDGDDVSLDELRAAYAELQRQKHRTSAPPAAKPAALDPDPYEADDLVTVLLPLVYRRVIAGELSRTSRVFVSGEIPGRINEDTGRPGAGIATTITFVGGVARHVRYTVAKGWKKSLQFRSDDTLKIVADGTPDTTFAKLCGVQPMQPQKQAAMLLASDLDAVLGEFSTGQLAVFAQALQRRVAATRQDDERQQPPSSDVFSSASISPARG